VPLYLALVAYSDYFSKPPHLTTALYQAGEGVSVIGFGFELVATGNFIVLLIILLAKLVITVRCPLLTNPAIRHSALFYTPAVLYAGILLVLGVYIKPLNATAANWSIDELMHGYGFAVPWTSEAIYVNQNALLEAAMDQARIVDNRLVGDSGLLTLPRKIFILQIESLDFDILQQSINGKEITPNINSILSFSRVHRVRAHHFSGSSDADFVMLTGQRPNQIVAPFKVYGFPYQDTLIDAAKSVGYKTKSYHGNSGFFFERRNAFVSMGIDEIVFREERIDRGLQPYGEWILDADLMRQIGLDANENDDKELYFVITVTSHGPFSFLPDKERHNIVQNASSLREKYLNSIHYVDRVMGDFFSAIPDDSLIVIYGDHESGTGERKLGADGRRLEYIPAILYYKTEPSSSQILRSYLEAKSDDNLYLADFSNLLISALSRPHDNDVIQ
jgi:phosphoglycerol transferase MdoB-like AlkP superfamily enzyme